MIDFLFNYEELELLFYNVWIIASVILIFTLIIMLSIGLVVYGIRVFKDGSDVKNRNHDR